MIFAREVTPELTSLVKKVDAATAQHKNENMGSFVVFCSDEEDLDKKLQELAKKEKIKETVLAIDNPAGPEDHNVAKEAHVTVVMYVNKTVKVNYAFKKGAMKAADVEKIVKDIPRILPEKN